VKRARHVLPNVATALGVAACMLLAAAPAAASPEDIFGYGTRSPALAGAGVSHGASAESAYLNPALLGSLRARRLTLGGYAATFDQALESAGAARSVAAKPARGFLIGAELPLPLRGVLRDRIGLALAFSTPSGVIVRGRVLYPELPQFPLYAERTQSVALRLGLGVDAGYGVSVGVGVAALAEIIGSVVVAQDAGGRIGSRVDDQLVATYAPTLGVHYRTGSPAQGEYAVGVVARGALQARFAVLVDATKLSTLKLPAFNIAGIAQYDPAQIHAEFSYSHGQTVWLGGAGVKFWGGYPGPTESTIPCPVDVPDCGTIAPPPSSCDVRR
jgi:hypothetical protein